MKHVRTHRAVKVSTHASVRRRQAGLVIVHLQIFSFNSRLREEATEPVKETPRFFRVSTHASVRRRPSELLLSSMQEEVSTHASVRRRPGSLPL